jgi:ribosomal protein L44E
LSDEPFEQLQKRIPNISQEVDDFLKKRAEELTGQSIGEGADYGSLKAKYSELVNKVAKKDAELKEITPYYHEANTLLAGLGLKKDFSNADELIPQFTSAWKGRVEFMHEYVSLVELARDKRQAERRLSTIRGQPKPVATPATSVLTLRTQDGKPVSNETTTVERAKEEDLEVEEDSDLENPAISEHPQECRAIVPVVSP